MKVILLENVQSLGKKGDVVKVSDGYARNYILPRNLGMEATGKNLHDLEQKKASEARALQKQLESAQALADSLKTKEVTVSMRVGAGGKPFGSITSREIADAFDRQLHVRLDRKKIVLPEAIKALGTFEVPVKLHPQVTGILKVNVKEA